MEKQQRNKLIVGIVFFVILTTIAAFAYVKIIIPNRIQHQQSGNKINIKTGYKTKINPDYIDSVTKLNSKSKK